VEKKSATDRHETSLLPRLAGLGKAGAMLMLADFTKEGGLVRAQFSWKIIGKKKWGFETKKKSCLDEISLAKNWVLTLLDDQVTSLQPSWIATFVELGNTMDN
jgi:hypothetical protein